MSVSVKYTGAVPGADTNTYNLLNSITGGWPGYWPGVLNLYRVLIDIDHDNTGTIKVYKSNDDLSTQSPTWVQVDERSIAAPAAASGTKEEFLVEAHKHTKIDWVNGGVAQTTFVVNIALSDDKAQGV